MSDQFLNFACPVKQKRALLRSNPPRDTWTEGDEMNVSILGRPKPPRNVPGDGFISEPSHASKNLSGRTVVRPGCRPKPSNHVANSRRSIVQFTLNQYKNATKNLIGLIIG
jgi:hypothetical protein